MSLTLSEIAKKFSDEHSAYQFVESMLWNRGVTCPHCGSINQSKFLQPRKGERKTRTGNPTYRHVWQCDLCHQQFSVLVGTIFSDSHIPLSKWLLAICEMCSAKNGVSSVELSRKLGITQKSAWHLAHRIRETMRHPQFQKVLKGMVEADETYIGGKAENMHKAKRERVTQGRGTIAKVPVLSAVERGGSVHSQKIPTVSSKNIREVLRARVSRSAILNTDTFPSYRSVGKEFATRQTVDHSAGEYVAATRIPIPPKDISHN
jgi:transposase-like protein